MVLFQPLFDFGGDRFQLRLRCPRTDDKQIGERRDPAKVEDGDVFGLPAGSRFSAMFG